MAPESGQPQGAVPQEVADELAALAAEISLAEKKADRAWKTSAIVFVILLAVIASYIGLLIYRPFKAALRPETLVQMAEDRVNAVLSARGAPRLDSPMLGDWLSNKIAEQAPGLMQQTVRPQIEDLLARAPEMRQKVAEDLKKRLPQMLASAVTELETRQLPQLRQQLVDRAVKQADAAFDSVEDNLDQLVGDVIAVHEQSMRNLDPENAAALRRSMEQAFENEMGPILDQMFAGIEHGIDATRQGLEKLVESQKKGTLTKEEQRELDLVRLVFALFKMKSNLPEKPGESLIDQLKRIAETPVAELSTPLAPPVEVTPAPAPRRPAPALDQVAMQEEIVKNIRATLARPDLPDEARRAVQKELDKALKRLEEAKKAAAAQPAPAVAAPAVPQASQADILQQKINALQDALKRTDLPEEGRRQVQSELEKAKKELEALQQQ